MIGFGKYFIKIAPKEINGFFGYRTTKSMKNEDTWEFAHLFCGKLWYMIGWVMLILSVIAMLSILGKDINYVGTFGGILSITQVVFLIGSIFPTEIALMKTFDKRGARRKK